MKERQSSSGDEILRSNALQLGRLIRDLRKVRGWSQLQLEQECQPYGKLKVGDTVVASIQVDNTAISRIERGNGTGRDRSRHGKAYIDWSRLAVIAQALGIEFDILKSVTLGEVSTIQPIVDLYRKRYVHGDQLSLLAPSYAEHPSLGSIIGEALYREGRSRQWLISAIRPSLELSALRESDIERLLRDRDRWSGNLEVTVVLGGLRLSSPDPENPVWTPVALQNAMQHGVSQAVAEAIARWKASTAQEQEWDMIPTEP